jgi:cell fate (sporulation/competence/biofilm development) regulator YlbF (YheA/YmcA/DUF963 family)
MSLSDWERNGWLTKHQTSPNEVRDLLQVVERDLADSASKGLSADWRLNIAYNAALQAATAALAAAGYRASRDSHHYRVIHSLRETVGTDASAVATFDAFRKKRNITGYERVGTVSDADAATMRTLAVRLRNEVIEWLKRHHGSLVPK